MEEPRDYTRAEAAARLMVSEVTLDRKLRAGAFGSYKVGRRVLVARSDVEAYLASCREQQVATRAS